MAVIRVLVVDDHTLVRRGLVSLLQGEPALQVAGEASSGEECLQLAPDLKPDVVLMDLKMPGMGGVDATACLRAAMPHLPIVILTVSEEDDDVLAAIRAGAQAYILKNSDADELVWTIQRVCHGEAVLAPAVTKSVFDALRSGTPAPDGLPLTQREVDVFRLLIEGADNREIAGRLMISENTVKTHVAHILEKLNLRSRAQVVAHYRNHALAAAARQGG